MSELTFGKLVLRLFLYVGIAVVVLGAFAVVIVLGKGAKVSGDWIALAVYTVGLFWVVIRQSRQYWQHSSF